MFHKWNACHLIYVNTKCVTNLGIQGSAGVPWWYNDLMISYNNSSQLLQKPVTTGVASVYWTLELGHRSTDVGWPGWSAPTVLRSRFGLQFLDLLYGFSPDIYITSVNISYRYCLSILSTWVEQSIRGLSWFMNNTIISYESHMITAQIRSGFYIYIYLKGPSASCYTISPWSNIITSPPEGVAMYCFHPVCLSVCLSVCLCVCVCVCPANNLVLEEISIWNVYRILIGLYSIHWPS